jgi:hypothetical protein
MKTGPGIRLGRFFFVWIKGIGRGDAAPWAFGYFPISAGR